MLVEALHDFEGTMLFVSHDRTFLRGLANRVLEIGGEDGTGRQSRSPRGAAPLPASWL
jgi:ATPase subunit of ABC transporter with duplicated ATPase domains